MNRILLQPFSLLVFLGALLAGPVTHSVFADETDPDVRRRFEQHALTNPGNAARGQKLFESVERSRCITCHRVGEKGGLAGPDLSRIGGKFDRPHLIESLLEPSRQIVEGYRTSLLILKSGEVKKGVIREESAKELTLLDLEGKAHRVATDQVLRRERDSLSLMPADLYASWSVEEFTDLIAYLETLRPGGKSRFGSGVRGPIQLPEGFEVRTLTTGLTGATALHVTPDGRILVCEQTGTLRVVKDGKLLDEPMLTVEVDRSWERGLIGVTTDPDFPEKPHVYICYVAKSPHTHHRVSRFTVKGDRAIEGSEKILFRGDDQSQLGGNVPAGHQGGAIHFGVDGHLYFALGEQTAGKPAQSLESCLGKILRIHPDGRIPKDNPFVDQTSGKYRAIWALGCRNPFTLGIERPSGRMLINDVGGKFEEINVGKAGANYGWPEADHGPVKQERFTGPVHVYPQASISGGDFVPRTEAWPEELRGRYLFADFVHGWIRSLDPDDPERAKPFVSGLRRPVDLRTTPGGKVYVLLRNAWVIDGKFQPGTGSLLEVRSANTGEGQTSSARGVRLDEEARDATAGNLPAFRVVTPRATYFLEKTGGGLSSLLDADGQDWLGFHPEPGSGAGGEYRGFPNAVHQQGGNYFHARNRATDPVECEVLERGAEKVSIAVRGKGSEWAGRYDFYEDRMVFTMTSRPQGRKYWILYEGTPGGEFEEEDWWITSARWTPSPLTETHEGDIPGPEWIAFGDRRQDRAILLISHQDDEAPDRYYPMHGKMTVFGFGRKGLEKYLEKTPLSFTITLVESRDPGVIARRATELLGP